MRPKSFSLCLLLALIFHLFSLGCLSADQDPFFAGGFHNLGYWKEVETASSLTTNQRIQSSQNLYRLVAEKAALSAGDYVLEVGCGQGVGAALLAQEHAPGRYHAIDSNPEQVTQAQTHTPPLASLTFLLGSAEKMPMPDNFYHKVLSVELAHELTCIKPFARETHRTLKPKGSLLVAGYFSTDESSKEGLLFIDEVKQHLLDSGFSSVRIEAIGEDVWPGASRWAEQVAPDHPVRQLTRDYHSGSVDYYLIHAVKS